MATTDLTIFTDDGYTTTLKIAEVLVKSGVLPRGIDNPFKAFAIIQKGREIGVGPMRALTGIALIEGKPTVSPELKLEQFRQRGGHVKWLQSDNLVAKVWLKAPNGDEHEETVTLEDMKTAGVASKDNWRKYPKSMLRARCVGFGLRALGEGDGSYTPDELGVVTNEDGEAEYTPPAKRGDDAEYEAAVMAGVREESRPKASTTTAPKNGRAQPAASTRGTPDSEDAALHGQLEASVLVDVLDPKTGEVVGREPKATNAQIAKAHILKDQLHISDEVWRKRLLARTGYDSSAKLAKRILGKLIDEMDAKTKAQQAKAREALAEVGAAIGMPTADEIEEENRRAAAPTLAELEAEDRAAGL